MKSDSVKTITLLSTHEKQYVFDETKSIAVIDIDDIKNTLRKNCFINVDEVAFSLLRYYLNTYIAADFNIVIYNSHYTGLECSFIKYIIKKFNKERMYKFEFNRV